MPRYYKATDGTVTVFRQTTSKVYQGAWWDLDRGYIGFSSKAGLPGWHPAVEIDKAEYNLLVARKSERIARLKAEREAAGQRVYSDFGSSPGYSWV